MESQAQLSQQHRSQTPNLQNFYIPKRRVSGHQPTCLPNGESTTKEGTPVAEGLYRRRPTALKTQEKTTETETRSSLATVYACTVPGWLVPGKIWMSTNQIRAISASAHVSRELRARALQALRVYKESRVAYRAIRVRVS